MSFSYSYLSQTYGSSRPQTPFKLLILQLISDQTQGNSSHCSTLLLQRRGRVRKKLPHLETRGGVYWVRIVIPRDLRNRLHRREWRFSLRTRDPSIARLRYLEIAAAIGRLHSFIRSMRALTDTQIA